MADVVILGAGIIGCSTAFYLSQSDCPSARRIYLVEPAPTLFACASGRAAGFLASNWFDRATASLGTLSFRLHKELAEEHNGRDRWGYSSSIGLSLFRASTPQRTGGRDYEWLGEGVSRVLASGNLRGSADFSNSGWLRVGLEHDVNVVSNENSTAQVDPLRLSQFLLDEAIARGVSLRSSYRAVAATYKEPGVLSGVHIVTSDGSTEVIPCKKLIITAGAWTPEVIKSLFPRSNPLAIPVSPLAGYSLVVQSPNFIGEHCHAVFSTDDAHAGFSPEIFSRLGRDGRPEIYIAGLNSRTIPLPDPGAEPTVEATAVKRLGDVARQLVSDSASDGEHGPDILGSSLCFRPVTRSGRPIIANIPNSALGVGTGNVGADSGVYVGVGHGPWGISLSLGTGKGLAEMVDGQQTSADVSALGLSA